MKNTGHDQMIRGFRRMAAQERKGSFRTPISRARHLDSVDWTQVPIKSSETLTDTDGVFWFIPGFDVVGGGTRVKP